MTRLLLQAALLALLCGGAETSARAQDARQDELGFGEAGESAAAGATPDEAGFADAAPAEASATEAASARDAAPAPGDKLAFQGTLRLRGGMWTERVDDNPFAQARAALDFGVRYSDSFMFHGRPASLLLVANGHGEYDAAYQYQRATYDTPTLETYEWQAWVAESFLSVSVGGLTLSVGRQVLNLGQAEMLGFIDALNPRDLREPGLADLDEIRLPVLMSRLGLSYSGFSLEAVVVYEALPSLMAPPLGSFSPFRRLIREDPAAGPAVVDRTLRLQHEPVGFAPDRWQVLGRTGFSAGGLDLELYAGSVLDRLGAVGSIPPAAFAEAELWLPLFHPRYTLVATAGALALGPLLLRWELGAELDKILNTRVTSSELLQFSWVRRDQIIGLLGLSYFGAKGTNIGIEAQRGYVFDAPDAARDSMTLLWPVTSTMLAFRWMQTFGDDVLRINLITALIGLEHWNGGFVRAELARKLCDGLLLSAGYVAYLTSDEFGPFYGFERNDRAQLQLRWDFGF